VITVGVWHHIVATYDGSTTGKIYIDGVNQAIDASVGTLALPDATASNIGRHPSGASNHFDGNICQVGIWSGALTQAQVQSVMEKTYDELSAEDKGRHGDEVNTTANATSPTNETDATTGWTATGSGALDTDSSNVDTSTHSLTFTADANEDEARASWTVDNTSFYRVRIRLKTDATNASGAFNVLLGTAAGGTQYSSNTYGYDNSPSAGTWHTITEYITTSSTTLHFAFQEKSASSNDLVIYVDNISVKKMNDDHDLVSYWALDVDGSDSHGDNDGTLT